MDNYLVDRETLGQFVDALIKAKYESQPVDTTKLREDAIRVLDARISNAVFSDLDSLQLAELSHLLDDEEATETTFQNFFAKSNINLEQKITDVFATFRNEFLGGVNA